MSILSTKNAVAVGLSLFLSIEMAAVSHGQSAWDTPGGMTAPVDVYGNAQTIHPERRPLDVFQNDAQRQTLGVYQTMGRKIGQRGYEPFALPADQFMRTMAGRYPTGFSMAGAWRQRTGPLGLQESERKAAFRSYGGFGQRRNPYTPGDPEGAFARKRELIAATGLTAPIERSKLTRGRLGSIRFPSARSTSSLFPDPGGEDPSPVAAPAAGDSLSRFLTSSTGVLHAQARSEGWKQFESGEFRAAVRSFESAFMLDPTDVESRIGAILAYVTIGSTHAASAALDALLRRSLNVFAYEVDVSFTQRYGDASVIQGVRLSSLEVAEGSEQPIPMRALAVFILWYLDAREDALRAARLVADKDESGIYARWPEQMKAARARQP